MEKYESLCDMWAGWVPFSVRTSSKLHDYDVVSDTRAYKQFGNAVVPLVAHAIAKQIALTMQWQRDSVSKLKCGAGF